MPQPSFHYVSAFGASFVDMSASRAVLGHCRNKGDWANTTESGDLQAALKLIRSEKSTTEKDIKLMEPSNPEVVSRTASYNRPWL